MKKTLVLLLIGALTMTTLLSGCGAKQDGEDVSATEEVSATGEQELSTEEEFVSQVVPVDVQEFEYDVFDYVDLGEYKDLDLVVDAQYEVTDDAVIESINQQLVYYPKQVFEGTVEDGNSVNITYVGTRDDSGEEFQPEASDIVTVGSNTYIPGFEEGLIGHEVGDSFDLSVTFPDPYAPNEDLSGVDATFAVTINYINIPITYDDLTDDYVSENFGIDTLDQFTENVRNSLERDLSTAVSIAAMEKITETTTVNDLPEGMLEQNVAIYRNSYVEQAESYGVTFADYLTYMGMTEETFDTQLEDMVRTSLEQQLIAQAIAEKEGLEVDEEGFQEYVSLLLSQGGIDDAQEIYDEFSEAYVRLSYLANNVVPDFLSANNNVTFETVEDDAAPAVDADDAE